MRRIQIPIGRERLTATTSAETSGSRLVMFEYPNRAAAPKTTRFSVIAPRHMTAHICRK
jgi:hypothetical protein